MSIEAKVRNSQPHDGRRAVPFVQFNRRPWLLMFTHWVPFSRKNRVWYLLLERKGQHG